jgi:hypothetical protein
MKAPDKVFRELGQLYEFQKAIKSFRFLSNGKPLADEVGQSFHGQKVLTNDLGRKPSDSNQKHEKLD